jgi:hypothetical protein
MAQHLYYMSKQHECSIRVHNFGTLFYNFIELQNVIVFPKSCLEPHVDIIMKFKINKIHGKNLAQNTH